MSGFIRGWGECESLLRTVKVYVRPSELTEGMADSNLGLELVTGRARLVRIVEKSCAGGVLDHSEVGPNCVAGIRRLQPDQAPWRSVSVVRSSWSDRVLG